MHDVLRERLWRHLEALPEERLYQVLDYIEFLASKYARDGVRPPSSGLQRFSERLEDRMRQNRVGYDAIRGTLQAMGKANRVVTGIAEQGRSILREVGQGLQPPEPSSTPSPRRQAERPPRPTSASPAPPPPAAPPPPREDGADRPGPQAGGIPVDG